jgi:hypothetical protein
MDTGSHSVLGPQAHTNSVSCLAAAYTAKGDEQLVSGGFDGWVCLWEPRQVRGIKPHMIARWEQAHRRWLPGLFWLVGLLGGSKHGVNAWWGFLRHSPDINSLV